MVEAGAGRAVVSRQPGQQQGEVAEARDRHDEGICRLRGMCDVQGHLQAPESLEKRSAYQV